MNTMADCGASGTAIDRAVADLSGLSAATGKHVSSLLGHAAIASRHVDMPMTAPSQLVRQFGPAHPTFLPQVPSYTMVTDQYHGPTLDQAWLQQQQQQPQGMIMNSNQSWSEQQQHPHVMNVNSNQHHAMQQHQMIIHQQQIMQMHVMMQKEWELNHQHGGDQQEGRRNEPEVEKPETQEPTLDNWYDNLEDNLAQGATIEDLAAAWAQAEADYDREAVAVDLASTYGADQYPYQFQNPMTELRDNDQNWMEVGLQEYNRGNLSEAVRAFETLVQLEDDHAQAWYYLGRCHAENDLDVLAIACLERSVERDPFSPETLLALGVSHVNELNHKKAMQNLKEWITHNPKYAGLESDDLYGGTEESELDQVQGLLLRALEYEATPDTYEALGVVYNVSRDYDAAVASFEQALKERPRDYSLWNKLGATLANSNASDRALPAYQNALKLRPKYARAWLNMAISHSNLQNYDQAARCYLQTLSLNPSATHCWSYLRIALSCQEQWDLLPLVSNQDLKAFQKYYDLVLYE